MRKLATILAVIVMPVYAQARQGTISVEADKVLNHIPEKLYGACIEDVNHEIYGGLYDQRLFGESFEEPAAGPPLKGWKVLGGSWQQEGEGVKIAAGAGYKLVYDNILTAQAAIEVQLQFGPAQTNAGILTHVNHERTGADNFWGYEISLAPQRQMLVIGKHRNNWELLKETHVSFQPQEWNTLKVVTTGNKLQVSLNGRDVLEYIDNNNPLPAGKTALRNYNAEASFRRMIIRQGTQQLIPAFIPAPTHNVSNAWDGINTTTAGRFILDTTTAYNGKQAQQLVHDGSRGRIGVANAGLNRWGIAIRKGHPLQVKLFLKAAALTGPVTIALQSEDGSKVYATRHIQGINNNWKKYEAHLTPQVTDAKARFVCYVEKAGKLWIDQAVLMSTGTDQFKGLPIRADIAVKMQQQGLNYLRYGGTMVNAAGYRWKKMIGPRDQRPLYKGHWYPYSTNGFGIEDFLQYCEKAGYEAAFAINIEETPQDAAEMIEYLKGDVTTTGGKQRTANGHPAPYKVRYIEIGNEEVLFNGDVAAEYDHYIERFNLLYAAMHAKDTSVQFINAAWWRPGSPNIEKVFRATNGKAAYWDLHTDADDPRSGAKVDSTLTRMQQLFRQWDPKTGMRCAIFEENGGRHDVARALGHATTLNAVRRHGDFVLTSCAANALQPYRQNDNGWDQGQIFFTPAQVWGMPPFYAQQMAARHHQPMLVATQVTGDLDVTTTCSEDKKTLVLHIVNPSATANTTAITIAGFPGSKREIKTITLSGSMQAVNTPEQPGQISSREQTMTGHAEEMNYTFPAGSYTIIRIER